MILGTLPIWRLAFLPNLGNLNVTAENKGHIARAALVYKFGGDCCERPFK